MQCQLLVIIPHWEGDSARVTLLAKLLVALQPQHAGGRAWIMLAARQDCPTNKEAMAILEKKFRVIPYQCCSPLRGYPGGSNGCFSTAMIEVACNWEDKVEAVLILEPDAFPCVPDWIDRLMAAWRARREGVHIVGHRFSIDGSEDSVHINGVALYNPSIARIIPQITQADMVGWDFACRKRILPVGDHTEEIRYMHYKREFADAEFPAQPPAIIHGVKDESLAYVIARRYQISL